MASNFTRLNGEMMERKGGENVLPVTGNDSFPLSLLSATFSLVLKAEDGECNGMDRFWKRGKENILKRDGKSGWKSG